MLTSLLQIAKHESNLFYYLLFIRTVPLTPHWYTTTLTLALTQSRSPMLITNRFLNMAAPIIGIPFWPFFFSILIGAPCFLHTITMHQLTHHHPAGTLPLNFVMVEAGQMLQEITSLHDVLTPWTAIKLVLLASLALLPAL